ncbi:SDR family oxidoreductase [Maribacter litopenaei]|uniref:SDR family oxidoreductase n=1 Tax=Maribacter litopenaei TaxID=2976127 RepID=A0ABY5Y8L7_9FLAO|nr:SDR family oxidoreductase [Maribacter litopenaei]UWX55234.1 SDR family oxidoreductase [Maribacter litopenaei]
MFSLKGKIAVITGAGSGIGRAIATLLAEQGAIVHVIEVDEDAAKETVRLVGDLGGKGFLHICDVSNQSAVLETFKKIDKIDILINNAGIAHIGTAENTNEADFDRICQINIKGVYNCLHACIPQMKKHGGGRILNMASIAATVGLQDRFAYSMSKAAVLNMTLTVAKDFIKDNITCNSISPARIHTPFVDGYLAKNFPDNQREMFQKLSNTQPIGRMAQPKEIAGLVLYLCSDEAQFITGTDYPIDGGFIKLNS